MNLNAGELLEPVFDFLNAAIADYGVYLYLLLVWLSVMAIAWIFSGGLRRRFPNQSRGRGGIGIIIQPHSPPPIILQECDLSDDETE